MGLLSPRSSDIQGVELEVYMTPPTPPMNPFIKRKTAESADTSGHENIHQPQEGKKEVRQRVKTGAVGSRRLIRPLLAARFEATVALAEYLTELMGNGSDGKVVEFLKRKARIGLIRR